MRAVSWRPIEGCSFASTGCANCTALRAVSEDLVREGPKGPLWKGVTRLAPEALAMPANLAEASAVHVCDHGDLFHEATPDPWIDAVFAVMEREPGHVFLILTKRAERMSRYVGDRYGQAGAPRHLVFGISAERQAELDERGPWLLATPGARYLSLYPLLGPVDLAPYLQVLAFVQAGDEAQRPAPRRWFSEARAQAKAAGVAFRRSSRIVA